MFRRARLSVKPNVRPGIGARGSTTSTPQRGKETPKPPEPAAVSAPKPAEPTDAPVVDLGGAEPQENAPRSSDEKTGGENHVEESSKSSPTVSQRRKRISSTSGLDKPIISVPSQPPPSSPVNQEVPQLFSIPAKEKQPCSDRYRIYKAQKLREMLKEELRKEKKQWKNKYAITESQSPPDRAKMTMRDFIYYLPNNNPMTSSLEQEKKTEKSLTPAQTREQESKSTPDAEENEEMEEEIDDGPLLVPRVKVAEDGTIILDEESLTVEVLRTKGPCVVEENDPIFERGSTTTYSSFRKNYYSKPWSNKETDMFFLAISMVGTDFSMIGQLFPHRARIEIKNKFKREEKTNGWRIDKAFQEKRPFDFDFFAHLLQKVLEEEEKRKQKSVKNNNSKEKKSSKPRKKVKVKKVSEEVNDDSPESMSTKISDTERLEQDIQTVEGEQLSLTLSEQDSGESALKSDVNQKKRRRRNQEEADEQEVEDPLGNVPIQSVPPKGEKRKNKCESLRPEVNGKECHGEQKLSCSQNTDEAVDLPSLEKVEKRIDPILSSSSQQDVMSVSTESSESSTLNLPSSEIGIGALSEANNTESSCTEERNVDLKNESLEMDQSEPIKPMVRGRLQRPKPNLSRAAGKKTGRIESEKKSPHPETSVEKNHMERDQRNTSGSLGLEKSEKENTEAETVSNLSENICLQKDNQPKAFRSARLTRSRLQRPKPNVGKVAERNEILASQEIVGTDGEKKENESCIDRDIPEQMEDQSCKILDCGAIASQSEKKDTSYQNVQPDEFTPLSECLSIQEDNEADVLKLAPVVRTRFQKPKPNIGKRSGRREIFSREEVPEKLLASEEIESALVEISTLETSPRKMVTLEANTAKEMDTDFLETGKRDTCLREKTPEIIDNAVEMRDTEKEIYPRENVSEVTDILEEIETDLVEARGEVSPLGKAPEEVKTVGEVENDLEKMESEISSRKKMPEMTTAFAERDTDLEETGRREILSQEKVPEKVNTIDEIEKEWGKTETELLPRNKIPEMTAAAEERETNMEETGREILPQERVSKTVETISEMGKDLEKTEKEISPRKKKPEMITSEEREPDLKETRGREISPPEKAPEEVKSVGEMETGFEETRRNISPSENIPEMNAASEESKSDLKETGGREISPQETETALEEVRTGGEIETNLEETGRDISPREKVSEEVSFIGEREIDLRETGKGNIFLMDKIAGKMIIVEEIEADLKDSKRESASRESESEEIHATEETVADLENTGKIQTASRENEPEETDNLRQTETYLIQSSSDDCSPMPSPDTQNISNDKLSVVHTSVEEKTNSEKEVPNQLSHSKTSEETSELGKTEDKGMQSSDVLEQFTDTNLSTSRPQEQKPFEVKTVPFVRSRFKRPKPNLARAVLKRETTEAERYVPGKKSEMDKVDAVVIQQNSEHTNNHPSQDDVASQMTPREKHEPGHKEDKAVIVPCVQPEKSLSPSHSSEPKEESQSTQAQENDLVASAGTYNINTFQQEMKESDIQTTQPIRRRLQRPRPNIRKIEQRQTVEKSGTTDIVKEERTMLQKDETEKFPAEPNSQVGTDSEVVSTEISERTINENQSHLGLAEILHVNKINLLDENLREEHKSYAPTPAKLVRRQVHKAKPNVRRAHSKRKEPGTEKDTADQKEARKPEDNLLQQGESDMQLLLKKKTELLTPLESSARTDCADPQEALLTKKDAQSKELGLSGSVEKETLGDNSMSSIIEEQYLSKPTSNPQLLKESNYSKIVLDRRTAISSASAFETDHSERRIHRKSKPNVAKGRGSKRNRGKSSKREPRATKAVLVTLRASQEEEEDDAEDFASDYEEESCHLAPEEVNKAPVFVPLGLRSPEPVATQIEETMEELEITVNVPDTTCVTTVEYQPSNTDSPMQEMKQEEALNVLSIEMTTCEQPQDETGSNDGSTEAAIALLTMGDFVLQSDIITDQGDGIGVLPDVHLKDDSHIPSSPDNVKHNIVDKCLELSSPGISVSPASFEENKIALKEQSTEEEVGLLEKVKENAQLTRNTTSKVTNNLRIRNRLPKPKPNLKRILGTKRLTALQKVPSLSVTKGEEVDIQKETEESAVKGTDLEDKNLGSIIIDNKEQSKLACARGAEGTSISQEVNLTERNDGQEERSQEVPSLLVASVASSETGACILGLDRGLGESPVTEPLIKQPSGDSLLILHGPQCTPATIPEVQQENVVNSQDLAVHLVANQDGEEEEQAFILTLVEIPTNAAEEFTNNTAHLMPNHLLPAPILIRSVNTEERGDLSISFPVTSVGPDTMYVSNSGRDGYENSANLDLLSRKRVHCRLEENDCVPPAKRSSLTSVVDCQDRTSEVCSKELINVFEETGESYMGQNIFPTSGSTYITPEPQKEQLEPTLQNIVTERITPQLPQDGMIVSDKEERTTAVSKSEQMDSRVSSSKPPLTRPGRRPLGFLSLICSKNNTESDEPTQVHRKKRLKPFIPTARKNTKRSNQPSESQKKTQESCDLLPSSSVNTQSENIDSLAAQVPCVQPLPKEENESSQNQTSKEELPNVSEYFFNDIFIEVDEAV